MAKNSTGDEMERTDSVTDVITFTAVVTSLAVAGVRLASLSERVRSTYRYVSTCSRGTDRLADQMAGLDVDDDTVAEHREAAQTMREVLDEAERLAESAEDLSTLFGQTSDAHRRDYGSVTEAAQSMTVPMANSQFYSNR